MTLTVSVKVFVYLVLCTALCSLEASPLQVCPQHCKCSQVDDSTSISAKCSSLEAIHKFLHRPKQKMRFRVLDASNANITKIDMNTLEKLTHLEQLDLSSNKISVISKFPHLSNLIMLNLSSNEINSFSAVVFPTSIQSLDLSNNKISELPINLKNLNDLKYFEVNENPLNCNCETVNVRDWLLRKKVVIKQNVLCKLSTGVYVSWLEVKSNTICQQKSHSKQRKDFDIDYMGDDPTADIGSGNVEDDTVSEFKNVNPIIDEQGSGDPDDSDIADFIPVIESKDHITSAPESNTSNDFVFDEQPTSVPEIDDSEHTIDRPFGSTTEDSLDESSGDGEMNAMADITSDDPDGIDDDYNSGNIDESPTSEKLMPVEYSSMNEAQSSTTEDPYDDSDDDSEASGDFDTYEASGDDDGSGAFLKPVFEEEIVAKAKQETLEQIPANEETQSSTSHAVIEPNNGDEIIMSVDREIESKEERHSTTESPHLSHEVHATREPSAEIIAGYTSAEGINEELGHVVDKPDSKQATAGTYVFLGILLAVLVCLLGFAIYRNQATKRLNRIRRQNKADVEKPATEMKEINKSLLIKEAEAMRPNGKPETLPLVKKEINSDTEIPKSNGFNNGRLPAADRPVVENDEKADVADSNVSEMQESPLTPETERVKIKVSELPESVPKTPVLVTRTRSSAGDIIVTPNENQRPTRRNNIPK